MRYNKYSNKKIKVDDYTFDSRAEAKRYNQLKLMLRAKKITDLILQPSFKLQDTFKDKNGNTHRSIKYVADFKYIKDGIEIVEDVKGYQTEIYKLKKKLLLFKYPDINFYEIS